MTDSAGWKQRDVRGAHRRSDSRLMRRDYCHNAGQGQRTADPVSACDRARDAPWRFLHDQADARMQMNAVRGASIASVSLGPTPAEAPLHFTVGPWLGAGSPRVPAAGRRARAARCPTRWSTSRGSANRRVRRAIGVRADYADAFAEWLSTLPRARRIWIGHSFGCRVGLQLAARHPATVDGLFLIAAAGLPRTGPCWSRSR